MAAVEPVVTEQPEAAETVVTSAGTGEWSSGICGCCKDMSTCCLGCICIPILGCSVSKKMGECCCTGCIAVTALRAKYRSEHGIKGSVCNDCLTSCFCPCCTVCQLARDLKQHQIKT